MPPSTRVAVRAHVHHHAGVAGVVHRVVDQGVVGRALQQHAAVAVELGIGRDPVHRVALDAVAVGVVDEDLLAEVAVDLVVLDDGCSRCRRRAARRARCRRSCCRAPCCRCGRRRRRRTRRPRPRCGRSSRFVDDAVGGARAQQHAPAELLDRAVAHDHVRAAADADAGREALLLAASRSRAGSPGRRSCGR